VGFFSHELFLFTWSPAVFFAMKELTMFHDHPLFYIVGLIGIIFVAYVLLNMGLDMGMVFVVIIAMIAAGIGGNMMLQRYRRMGRESFLNSAVNRMDPTLPAPFPEHADPLSQASIPYHMQRPYHQEEEMLFGGPLPTNQDYSGQFPTTPPGSTGLSAPSRPGQVTVTEIPGPEVRGVLTPGVSQLQHHLPESHAYEMQLADNAYVDITQAFINALLLDPTGNIPRVMAEEIAMKSVPLLFVDTSGDYRSLLREFPYGYHLVSSEAYEAYQETANAQTFALSQKQEGQCADFGQSLVASGWQALFDFASYTSVSEATVVMSSIIDGMVEWERRQYKQSNRYLPAIVLVDDASRFCPDENRQSLHRDNLDLAQAVRAGILKHLRAQGKLGVHWYLIVRRIAGMDPEALKQCILWIVHQPAPAEVKLGWLSPYLGLSPADIERLLPSDAALILDRTVRSPQVIQFRHSHSEPSKTTDTLSSTTFSLPAFTNGTDGGTLLPFQKR
jgi:hypothetical protein